MYFLFTIFILLFGCDKTVQNASNLTPGLWGGHVNDKALGIADINSDVYFYVELIDENIAEGFLFHTNGKMILSGSKIDQCVAEEFITDYKITKKGIELDCMNSNTKDVCISALLKNDSADINIVIWDIYSFNINLNNYSYVDDNFILSVCDNSDLFLHANKDSFSSQLTFKQVIQNMRKNWIIKSN